jgi:DNA-binding transcriptional ArsR family regulator
LIALGSGGATPVARTLRRGDPWVAASVRTSRSTNTLVATNVFSMLDPLAAAAEPTRRRILQLLAAGPRTVGEVAAEFSVTRSAISQHLLVLAEAGLVEASKAGRHRIYRVVPDGLQRLQAEIDRFWTGELERLAADADAQRRTP